MSRARRAGRRKAKEQGPAERPAQPSEPLGKRAFLALVVLCAVLYGRSLSFDFTRTDDTVQLVDSARFVGDLGNLPEAFRKPFFPANGGTSYYRPVVTLTYMLDAQWTGVKPFGYHLTNVVLHLAAGWLFLLLARRLSFAPELSLFGAAILVAHPGLTEAVAWVPGRGDSLLAIWLMAAALSLLRWLDTQGRPYLLAHTAFILLALFTKEAAVALPVLFAGYTVLVARRRAVLKKPHLWASWTLPLAIWYAFWDAALATQDKGPSGHLTEASRHLPVLLMYLGKAVWPSRLSVLAIEQDTPWLPGALALVPVGIALFWLRGGHRRLFLWGLGAFVVLLAPSLAVSDFLILEIRLYAPLVALLLAFLAVLQQARDRWPRPVMLRVQRAGAGIVVTALALRSAAYMTSFRDVDSFTRQATASSPRSALAHLNRGIALHLANDFDQAQTELLAARALDAALPVVHNNLGLIELRRGRLEDAERLFREELSLNPTYDKASVNLALVLKSQGRLDEAAASLHAAIAHNPHNEDALEGLASYYAFRGDAALASHFGDRLREARNP